MLLLSSSQYLFFSASRSRWQSPRSNTQTIYHNIHHLHTGRVKYRIYETHQWDDEIQVPPLSLSPHISFFHNPSGLKWHTIVMHSFQFGQWSPSIQTHYVVFYNQSGLRIAGTSTKKIIFLVDLFSWEEWVYVVPGTHARTHARTQSHLLESRIISVRPLHHRAAFISIYVKRQNYIAASTTHT